MEYLQAHSQKSLTAIKVLEEVEGRLQILIAFSTLTITDFSFKNRLCQEGGEPSCRLQRLFVVFPAVTPYRSMETLAVIL